MPRLAIYLFPIVMDLILSAVMFLVTTRAALENVSSTRIGGMLATWALMYMLTSAALIRFTTRRRAAGIMLSACVGSFGVAIGFILWQSLLGMYAMMAIQGIAAACFFGPFQVFMKHVDAGGGRSVAASTGIYTWAWSTGFAIGPFINGYLWEWFGWTWCHLTNAALLVAIAAGIYWVKEYASADADPEAHPEHVSIASEAMLPVKSGLSMPQSQDYARMPNLAWMAWVFGGLANMVISMLRGVFPISGTFYGISRAHQGVILGLFSAVQAFVALGLGRFRYWAYQPLVILASGMAGVLAFALFYLGASGPAFALAAICLGIYSGAILSYFVFHSLVHPTHSARYVATNEAVVGLMGILGPMIGGLTARVTPDTSYTLCGIIVLVMAVAQTLIHWRYWPAVREAQNTPADFIGSTPRQA